MCSVYRGIRLAPQVGLEPTTLRLTAECSAIELLRSVWRRGSPSITLAEPANPVKSAGITSRVTENPFRTLYGKQRETIP